MKMKKNYTRETFKNRVEWLNSRGFGGSSASAILGLNPYQNAMDLYLAYTSKARKTDHEQTESQLYGTLSEPLIRKQFELDFPYLKVHTPRQNEMFRRIDKPYMTATVDGYAVDKDTKEKIIIEIKTHDWRPGDEEIWNNGIPINYLIQVLHYFLVLNDRTKAILIAKLRWLDYDSDRPKIYKQEIRYYEIFRDDEAIQKWLKVLEKAETDFYENHIKKGIPPDIKIDL